MMSSEGSQARPFRRKRLKGSRTARKAMALAAIVVSLTACDRNEAEAPPPVRIVRTVTVEPAPDVPDLRLTGHIEAQDQAALSFRIGGRLAARMVGVGAGVREGEIVARLDPETELNQLRSARAALTGTQGALRKAENQLQRQRHLLERNVTTQADFEAAEQARTAAQAELDALAARVRSAEDFVGFTTLKADAPGLVTDVGAEPGEVVAAGRMILRLARREGRDAVFEVPADTIRVLPPDARVEVSLSGDPGVTVIGRVREVAPQADPVTRTFRVRVGLSEPPRSFHLGTTVSGSVRSDGMSGTTIPSTALIQGGGDASVWIVDPASLTVSMRKLDVISADPAEALVRTGLALGDIVVTAGASLLKEGQRVRLAGSEAQ